MVLMIGESWWSGLAALQCAALTVKLQSIFNLLVNPGVVLVPGSFLAMVLCMTGGEQKLTAKRVSLLCIVPAVTLLAVATNPLLHLYISHTHLVGQDPRGLAWTDGPMFIVGLIYAYLLVAVAVVILARFTFSATGPFRKQGTIVLVGSVLPWLTNSFFNLHFINIGAVDLTPVAFCISGLSGAWAIFGVKALDLFPVPGDLLVEKMCEALIVVDRNGRIVDLNPAARLIFKVEGRSDNPEVIGKRVDQAVGDWAAPLLEDDAPRNWEARAGEIDLDVQVTPLSNRHGDSSGYLVLARDVTESRQAQQELRDMNQALRRQIDTTEKLRFKLEEQAVRDPLTGVFNRRYLDLAVREELTISRASGQPISIVLIDVDNFKHVNDTLGHAGGDKVLRDVAGVLVNQMRSADVCCRFGGDEFLVILPGVEKHVATKMAERWRGACRILGAPGGIGAHPVTISAGISSSPEDGTDVDSLLRAADDAMYRAKNGGRDRVVGAGVSS
jgi:diguanylate cyclase (GGDEF)-like protein